LVLVSLLVVLERLVAVAVVLMAVPLSIEGAVAAVIWTGISAGESSDAASSWKKSLASGLVLPTFRSTANLGANKARPSRR
jgi:hypothetical protein